MGYAEKYPNLQQVMAGYFCQYWEELYFPNTMNVNTRDAISLCIRMSTQSEIDKTISELKDLLFLNLSEEQLSSVIHDDLGSYLYVPALGITYKEWLEEILSILKSDD